MTTEGQFTQYMREAIRGEWPSDLAAAQESYKAWKEEFDYDYNRRRWSRVQDRVAEWLRGLPSAASIEYRDYYIGELGREWYKAVHGKEPTAKQIDHLIERWWDWCAQALIKIWTNNGVIL